MQTTYDVREQRFESEAAIRRLATEYRVALIEGRLHTEEETDSEWNLDENVEEKVEQLEVKAVMGEDGIALLENEVDRAANPQL